MSKDMKQSIGIVVVVLIIGSIAWVFMKDENGAMMEGTKIAQEQTTVSTTDVMMKTEEVSMMESVPAVMDGSGYVTYASEKLAFAQQGKVILFFRAGWCPTCRAADADIRAHLSDIPKNVLILDVDYDNAKDLKQKYGVTYQHTFVQVDAMGNQIAKWQGSATLEEFLTSVQ